VNLDMLATAKEKFAQDSAVEGRRSCTSPRSHAQPAGEPTERRPADFLARAELLARAARRFWITDYSTTPARRYIARGPGERIGIVMGVPELITCSTSGNHAQLLGRDSGELRRRCVKNGLEALRLPVPAVAGRRAQPSTTSRSRRISQPCMTTWPAGSFVNLDNYRPDCLHIFSRDVLRRIAAGDESWESMVPTEVAT